jgi:hypothetical protein
LIIRIITIVIIITMVLLLSSCCQPGSSFSSFLEGLSSQEETMTDTAEDDKETKETAESENRKESNNSSGSEVSCWILALGGDGRDYAPSLTPTDDGYVAVGMTTSYGLGSGSNNLDGSHDFMAVRLNKKGELIWSTVIGGPEDERGSFSVTPSSDEGFILTGTTRSYGSGVADIFVVKLDARGRLVWARTIGGNGQETGKTTLEIVGGYITMGDTSSGGAGESDLLVVKYDRDGNIIWVNAVGGPDKDQGAGIAEVSDGFIIGGTIWSYGAGGADGGYIKLDGSGNILWAKTVGGSGDEGINWDGVRVLTDGSLVLGEGTTSYGASNQAICCMMLEPDLSVRWAIMIDGPQADAGWTMNRTPYGYIAGGKFGMGQDGGDVIFIRIDDSGRFSWARVLGDEKLDEIEEIIFADGGYVMAGVTRLAENNGDFLVAKVNEDGFVGGDSDPVEELTSMTVTEVNPAVSSFSPVVTDVSSKINILSVSPNVEEPNLEVNLIHSN